MKYNPVYTEFKKTILAGDMTPQQIRDMSVADVKEMCPEAKAAKKSAGFIMNMQRYAAMAKQSQIDKANIAAMEEVLTPEQIDLLNSHLHGLKLEGGSIWP